MQRTCHKTIVIHPHTGQFVINELPTLVLCGTVWVYGGMEGLPLTAIATVIALMLSLLLLYRYLYLRRIRYCIGTEQLVSEYGIIRRKVDYMELYRIVDFQEHQSLLQQFCGLKTVRILSMDRNTPRLDLIGIFHRDDLVSIIRERVETNKRKREYMKSRIISLGWLPRWYACFHRWQKPKLRLPIRWNGLHWPKVTN